MRRAFTTEAGPPPPNCIHLGRTLTRVQSQHFSSLSEGFDTQVSEKVIGKKKKKKTAWNCPCFLQGPKKAREKVLGIWWSKGWEASVCSGAVRSSLALPLLTTVRWRALWHRPCQSYSPTYTLTFVDGGGGAYSAPLVLPVMCSCVSLIVWTLTIPSIHLFQAGSCFKSPFPSVCPQRWAPDRWGHAVAETPGWSGEAKTLTLLARSFPPPAPTQLNHPSSPAPQTQASAVNTRWDNLRGQMYEQVITHCKLYSSTYFLESKQGRYSERLHPLLGLLTGHLSQMIYNCEGLPRWYRGKEFTCQFRRLKRHRLDPWVGKIPWSRKWQYSCLESRMDRGAWRATVHGVTKSQTALSN